MKETESVLVLFIDFLPENFASTRKVNGRLPPHIKCLVTKHFVRFVSMANKDFNFTRCFKVMILKNRIKRALKVKDVVNLNKEGMTKLMKVYFTVVRLDK